MLLLRVSQAIQNMPCCRTFTKLVLPTTLRRLPTSYNTFQKCSASRHTINGLIDTKNSEKWRTFNKIFMHQFHRQSKQLKVANRTVMYYCIGFVIFVGGSTYASVLLYRMYCQATGKGGRAVLEESGEKVAKMKPNKNRTINVQFNADINSQMMWNFRPSQPHINVSPGETALAFYTAVNPTDKAITGVATYNILPYEAGKYFNKIQCFCFEEQQLNPLEEVDMPVFFFVDPEYAEDPKLENIHDLVLSYTFFEAKEGLKIPVPSFT